MAKQDSICLVTVFYYGVGDDVWEGGMVWDYIAFPRLCVSLGFRPQAPVRSPGVYDNGAPPSAHSLMCGRGARGVQCGEVQPRPCNLAGVYMASSRPCLIKMLQPHTFALVTLDVGLGIIIRLRRMWAYFRTLLHLQWYAGGAVPSGVMCGRGVRGVGLHRLSEALCL